MLTVPRLKNIFLRQPLNAAGDPMHTSAVQFKAWRKASRRMGWSIGDEEFDAVAQLPLPCITDEDRNQGFWEPLYFTVLAMTVRVVRTRCSRQSWPGYRQPGSQLSPFRDSNAAI